MSGGGGVAGAAVGGVSFLGRVTSLEREINFLKQKVEDDARWKHLLEQWILDNFAFDIRGALLAKQQRDVPSYGALHTSWNSQPQHVKREQRKKSTRKKRSVKKPKRRSSSDEEEEEEVQSAAGEEMLVDPLGTEDDGESETERGGDNLEVRVHPRDLIITPSHLEGKFYAKKEALEDEEEHAPSDIDFCVGGGASSDGEEDEGEVKGGGGGGSDSSSSSEGGRRRKGKNWRMEWVLHSTYPNVETMKANFNLRDWGLMTTCRTPKLTKFYYYCKMCRKKGPGRMIVRYASELSEVEVLKNTATHDHSQKTRLSDEMKAEIVNLHKAGLKGSKQILSALKVSKPDLRQPSPKQVNYTVKKVRKFERKEERVKKKTLQQPKKGKKVVPFKGCEGGSVGVDNPTSEGGGGGGASGAQLFLSPPGIVVTSSRTGEGGGEGPFHHPPPPLSYVQLLGGGGGGEGQLPHPQYAHHPHPVHGEDHFQPFLNQHHHQ